MWTMKHSTTTVLLLATLEGTHRAGADRILVNALARRAVGNQTTDSSCTEYTELVSPMYTKCTIEQDGHNGEVLQSQWRPQDLCMLLDGKPCRSSYYCENPEQVYVDCRNVIPDDPNAGVDCDGNALPLSSSPAELDFKSGINACSQVGWNCVGTYMDLASCYWYDFLSDGTKVTISTDEPYGSIGDPLSSGYYGECFAKVGGLTDNCNSCEISCIEDNDNYATFDCSNLSSDPCAITENCYRCQSDEPPDTKVTLQPDIDCGLKCGLPTSAADPAFHTAAVVSCLVGGAILMVLGL